MRKLIPVLAINFHTENSQQLTCTLHVIEVFSDLLK